jgi:hypothetical protein
MVFSAMENVEKNKHSSIMQIKSNNLKNNDEEMNLKEEDYVWNNNGGTGD